ncbi:unnamed protein product [Nezara viridula]|uniref:Uncharacterized protein n=1 Tax=Nezara viridula TaxID=85310 RepID=A0A9P0HHA3_NEZVI|nr:unnamed protein product [Nezara viridula]
MKSGIDMFQKYISMEEEFIEFSTNTVVLHMATRKILWSTNEGTTNSLRRNRKSGSSRSGREEAGSCSKHGCP